MIISYKNPALITVTVARADRATTLPVLRGLILGAVSLILIVLALSRAGAVGAATPANCVAVNATTCISNGMYYSNGNSTGSVATAYTAPYSYVSPYGSPYAYTAPNSYGALNAYVAPNAYAAPNTASSGYPAVVSRNFCNLKMARQGSHRPPRSVVATNRIEGGRRWPTSSVPAWEGQHNPS